MMKGILDIKTVHECNCCLGGKTLHPQVGVIRIDDSTDVEQHGIRFDFYTVLLIDNRAPGKCCRCCGMKGYDFSDATMVFLSPEKAFDMTHERTLPRKGWLLAFHPDLLCGTTLDHTLGSRYTFFSYSKNEALHLSAKECDKIECCLQGIDEELHHPIDAHSSTIITRHIELLLDYSKRYYQRQFITREDKNNSLMERLCSYVNTYIMQGRLADGIFPSAEKCAEHLNLSTQYFKDLLKFVTGNTLREYVEMTRLGIAKQMLSSEEYSPTRVASCLGYPSVRQFSLMFKKITGTSPAEYKSAHN